MDAKNNVNAFIEWARGLGLKNPDIFTPEDVLGVRVRRLLPYETIFTTDTVRDRKITGGQFNFLSHPLLLFYLHRY